MGKTCDDGKIFHKTDSIRHFGKIPVKALKITHKKSEYNLSRCLASIRVHQHRAGNKCKSRCTTKNSIPAFPRRNRNCYLSFGSPNEFLHEKIRLTRNSIVYCSSHKTNQKKKYNTTGGTFWDSLEIVVVVDH